MSGRRNWISGGRWALGLSALLLVGSVPVGAQVDLGTDAQRETGKRVYDKYCSQCHGDTGAGDGYAAPFLRPKPRDFTSGKYKIRSTPNGFLPTDDDIRRVIQAGIPYTAMPAFPEFSAVEVTGLIQYLKTFSSDFEDPEAYAPPLAQPAAPPYSADNVASAVEVYEQIGCARCHGVEGRGDGASAPTLVDDWGDPIRAADLSEPWTFRGGATREDIYRSISTGLNGTPMAGFESGLTPEERWKIVDFIYSLADGQTEPGYASLVTATSIEGGLELERGEEMFASAKPALLPVMGQIVQLGRAFHPGVRAVEVRAVYDESDIAFMVSWSDIQANRNGENSPHLQVEELVSTASGSESDEGGFWGEEEATEDGGDFWGEEESGDASEGGGDDFWGDDTGDAVATLDADTAEFSDAIALQFPRTLPTGIRQPYFINGDSQHPVELWYVDLGYPDAPELWEGRGSAALTVTDEAPPYVTATYKDGQWTVIFKRSRTPAQGIGFAEDTFVPLALSVWDGFNEERGSRRGLTAWYPVYVPPLETVSPVGPMVKTAGGVLLAELLLILWVRRRVAKGTDSGDLAGSAT
ncbi:MAG: c-type cytochrome [Thermoanaerobaculia bacterium]|nr:c-type cytochrome [Thermoanaerobaculia bacterium]